MEEMPPLIRAAAEEQGFECIGEAAPASLKVNPAVRDMCAADRCSSYGRNWTCPPACGSLAFYQGKIRSFSHAILVQTVASLEDSFDFETMEAAAALHKKRLRMLRNALAANAEIPEETLWFLGAGACDICPECSYPNNACRHPKEALVSMEAAGLWVSEVCETAHIPYNHGPLTIAYTGCVFC